ncbi:MAG: hypothetical protein R6U66_02015 [Bacteroidales bacterium]
MIRQIKSNRPGNILLILFFAALTWMGRIWLPNAVEVTRSSPLYATPLWRAIDTWLQTHTWFDSLFPFLLLLVVAFMLVRINRKYILLNERTYLPALFFVLMSGAWLQVQGSHPVWLVLLPMFLLIDKLFQLYRSAYALGALFMAGFYIALGSLFYVPFLFYLLLVYVALVLLRPFIGREWLVPLLGLATPYLFVFTYYYAFTENFDHYAIVVLNNLDYYFQWPQLNLYYQIYVGLMLFLVAIASLVMVGSLRAKKVRTRKFYELFLWIFILSVAQYLLLPNVGVEVLLIAILPTTFIFTEYMYHTRRKWSVALFFYAVLLSTIALQLLTYFELPFLT